MADYMGCSSGGMSSGREYYREILDGERLDEAKRWIDCAARVARKAPCSRSRRGVVIVKYGANVGQGFNGKVGGGVCEFLV